MSSAAVLTNQQPESGLEFLAGGGELGALMREHDWASTPLGRPEFWPRSLKTAVRIMLTSRQPIWIGWGRALIYLYNDPYKSIIGGKHPWALGRPTSEVWREIWDDIGPMLATAMKGDEGTYVEEQLLIMERSGYREETYYTFSYSPIPDDDGSAGGIICANTDDTRRVIGERQLALLREIAAATAEARTVSDACARTSEALATDPKDIPFALLYLREGDGLSLSLCGVCGLQAGHEAAPATVALGDASPWPFEDAVREQKPILVGDLEARICAALPHGAWTQSPSQAALIPVPARGDTVHPGVLVVGLNPFRLFDDDYRRFLELAAGEIGASIANAKAYEEERRRAAALEEINRAKTEFFSNVSHEFRTPLTLLMGPLEELLRKPDQEVYPDNRALVEVAHRNGLRLLKLVNSLLDFSRIEAGRAQARYQKVDLSALTAELASTFRSATDRAGLDLIVDCPPLPAPVFVDGDMWEKIILNLISNAFKFTFVGNIVVRIRPENDRAVLTVSDTGIGIAAEELPRLFERFHRVPGARGRSFEGSGIGLALVHELVKLHGGSITVESTVGRGTAFAISIPFGTAHLPADRISSGAELVSTAVRPEAFVEEALSWLPQQGGLASVVMDPTLPESIASPSEASEFRPTILLADDNLDMRHYLRRLLGSRFDVETAGDGEEALAIAKRRPPSLIISDVMMPRLDGFGLVKSIRSDPGLREIPIILLSARAGEEAKVSGLDSGADDYLVKPFSARELVARVQANLQMSRIRKDAEKELRKRTSELEAVLETVPAAVWFTHEPDAKHVIGNRQAAALLQMPPGSNASLSAPAGERPNYRVFRNGEEVAADKLPIQRAARGESVQDDDLEVRFENGQRTAILIRAAPVRGPAGDVQGAVAAALDISERKKFEERQQLLINELNHRVKNTLATVQSIAMQTLRVSPTPTDARRSLDLRLIALSKAHDVLTHEQWEGADLRELILRSLSPYLNESAPRFEIDGPALWIAPKAVLALSMALHELATNAVKYGALSKDTGRVRIAWDVDEVEHRFRFSWRESGGPPVVPPARRGFGSRLIERGLAQDIAGHVALAFEHEGVRCTIDAGADEILATGDMTSSQIAQMREWE